MVRASIQKKFGFPVIPKIQVVTNKAIKTMMVIIARILRNNCIVSPILNMYIRFIVSYRIESNGF